MERTLSCGHKPSPHGPHTTGTAHTSDGREICWDCAEAEEKRDIRTADKWVGYLDLDHNKVTNWPGRVLGTVTVVFKRRHNMAGTMYYFDLTMFDGSKWYGRGVGSGMICRLYRRKSKLKAS